MSALPAAVRWSLTPLSAAYGAASWLRRAAHRRGLLRQARLAGPVISVGNLSVGGSGKTPVVAAIAAILREAGHPVAILSRGYRGSFAGEALIVSDGERVSADAALAGDEPVMLARDVPGAVVAVGRRRDRVGRMVEQRFGPRVHVLDDGFQHLRLARDLDVVCVTQEDLDDWPLPAGRLREFSGTLSHAQAVLISGGEGARIVRQRFGALAVLTLDRQVLGFFDREGRRQTTPVHPFAFCGIARPERFLSDLATQAPQCVGQSLFGDHHAYSADEMGDLVKQARTCGADALVTTAKDVARVSTMALDLPLLILRISVAVQPAEDFRRLVLATAQRRAES
jgi:tetraacyldisaccharide 4'-kinase